MWHGADGQDVGGYVFAGGAVATGGCQCQPAVHINDFRGKTVDFRFHDVFDTVGGQRAADTFVERPEFVVVHGVLQRQHGDRACHLGKLPGRDRADPAGGGIGRRQFRVRGFDVLQFTEKPIVFGVVDFRGILLVVETIMAGDFRLQPSCPFHDLASVHDTMNHVCGRRKDTIGP